MVHTRVVSVFSQVHKDPNFTPCLLQIVVDPSVPDAPRQAGTVCTSPHGPHYSVYTTPPCLFVMCFVLTVDAISGHLFKLTAAVVMVMNFTFPPTLCMYYLLTVICELLLSALLSTVLSLAQAIIVYQGFI